MYQVLYRKWRPKCFADVAGQPQVTVTLQNELKAGRVAHAYLFTGSRGTGKTTCAKILAKAVNCLAPVDGDPCGECALCCGIDSGAVTDVVEIDAASNNGVDNIRELREEVHFTPAEGKYRVYIIDEVHMLSIGAFNALLKTLEEPPPHVVFILATTEVHKLPATILSRCQRFDFHRIAPEAIADRLEYVCTQENAELDRAAGLLIARLADGALRDALSLLDQCMGRSRHITTQVVTDAAGLAGNDHLCAMADAIAKQDLTTLLEKVDTLHSASKDMARLCEELISHFRNIMLYKTMRDPGTLILAGEEERAIIERQAHEFTLPAVLHVMTQLQQCLERMSMGSNRRVEMEVTLIRLCSPELDTAGDAVVRRLEQVEQDLRRVEIKAAAAPAAAEDEPPARKRTKKAVETTEPMPAPSMEGLPAPIQTEEMPQWDEVLEALHTLSPSLAAYMHGSRAFIDGKYCLIDAPNSMAFEMLRNIPAQKDKMRDAIRSVTGKTYKLGPYKGSAPQKKPEADPLDRIAAMAREMDIPLTETLAEPTEEQ